VNGGNCRWGDLNWVHSVQAAWKCYDHGAPLWFRVKNRVAKSIFVFWERHSLRQATLIITNSDRTRKEAINKYRLDPRRVHAVYLGSDQSLTPVTATERCRARERFHLSEHAPVVLFVGALSYDNNKGLDTLLTAWRNLCADRLWDAHLLVAGGGSAIRRWTAWCADNGLADRITFLGLTERIPECLAAADILVSPVRYEGYGLNVHEAICRGLAFMVSSSAGIAERIPEHLSDMLIDDPEDAASLADRLRAWRTDARNWKSRIEPLRTDLSRYRWSDMAEKIINLVEPKRDIACC
jgi:glycosyltransferase involved in cell wall biosynthesis